MEHSTCFIGTLPGAWTSHKAAIPMGEVRGTIGYMGERFCLAANSATRFWLSTLWLNSRQPSHTS